MTQEIDSVQITQAERIIDKYSVQIASAFNDGVEKVTPLAEKGWELAVQYQKAVGIAEFTKAGAALLVIFLIFYIQRFLYKKAQIDDDYEGSDVAAVVFGGLAQVTSFIYCAACIVDGVLRTKAPEWFALKEIMAMFKG